MMGGMPAHALHAPILAWYDGHARDLPWRRPDRSPWGVFLSEIMLQQTQVARVLPAWHAWLDRWPAPGALAAEPPGEAIRMWDRLGYPRRALRLHAAAAAMVERHGGAVPDRYEDLLALPGVGAYTAAAVASFAFGQRHAVVDTNVRRVHARAVTGAAAAATTLTTAEAGLAVRLLPDDAPTAARWGVAAMELGALVCTARSPACARCPVRDLCRWQALGAPPAAGPQRRGQGYEGTDRRVRGLLLAALRGAFGPVPHAVLLAAVPDDALRDPAADPYQRERCLDGLVADGLVEPVAEGRYRLPG
jgi:A/G-specific adenine glycosylase